MVDTTNILGGVLLEPDRSTSQANLYSQVFERVKDALSNETKASSIKLLSLIKKRTAKVTLLFYLNLYILSPAQDSSLYTKANPQSTSCTLKDKKYISKNKEREDGRISSRIKKKGDDESLSMYSLGASLGITLDGNPARSNNDVFSDFLLEVGAPHIILIILVYNIVVEIHHLGSSTSIA
ncbi:hypothetical protein Tco_1570734 [Tanacetum coccineum]